MKLFVVFSVIQLVSGLDVVEDRGALQHESSTCAVSRTVTTTVTVSTCSPPAYETPPAPKQAKCGRVFYDPTQYVCHNTILCPILNGLPLPLCNTTCFSPLTHTCNTSHLTPLPSLPASTRFILTASNPSRPHLHSTPVTVCNHTLRIGGRTCSYCPLAVRRTGSCPPGNTTVLVSDLGRVGMAVAVPGGQGVWVTREGRLGVGVAHSGFVPPGASLFGFEVRKGGGFGNIGVEGWEACGRGRVWELWGRNGTSKRRGCVGVDLRVEEVEEVGAWEYT